MMNKKERKEWLEERRTGIGGSDVPVILGISNYKTPFELWQEKTGQVDLDSEDTPVIKRGRTMEPIIADMYTEITNRVNHETSITYRHPNHPFLIGNIDRTIYDPARRDVGVLEIKAPGLGPFGRMVRDNAPRYQDYLQLQHYLNVSGAQWGAIACHNSERWQLIHWDIQKDEETIRQIEEECIKFWKCVQDKTPPENKSIDLRLPDMAGEAKVVAIDNYAWSQAVDYYKESKELEAEVNEMLKNAKADMKEAMGDFTAVEGHGVRAYLSRNKGRKTFDKKALTKAYPDIDLSKFEKEGKPFEQFKVYFLRENYE